MNMNRVYVSTSCLKNPKNVLEVLTEYEKAGIENVEPVSYTHLTLPTTPYV